MIVYVNSITGIDDAIVSTMMSKRSWTRDKELDVRDTCERVMRRDGCVKTNNSVSVEDISKYNKWLDIVIKYGWKHITLLRYIDISVTVNGLHRAGQDDWDSHAKRFDNRIVRSSTRLADYNNEMSEFYKGKIIPTDMALGILGINTPEKIVNNGKTYVKTVNGYILEEYAEDKDIKRGLYMLSIPSDFIFKINLTEFAHVYKMRNKMSTAHPEVKECCEKIVEQLVTMQPKFTRELLEKIQN